MGENMNDVSIISENKKCFFVIGIIGLIGIFIIIYFFIFNNSKNIFLRAINNEYQKLDDKISNLSNNEINKISKNKTVSTNYKLDFDIDVDDSLLKGTGYDQILDEIDKLNLEMDGAIDRKSQKLAYNLSINYDSDNLLDLGIYAKEKSIYIELKKLFDKYIEIPVENYDELFDTNDSIEDSSYVLKTIKDAFLKNLNKNDFIKTKDKIDLNGKSISTKKITYSLNEKKSLELLKKALTDLKQNDNFIEKTANITGKKKSEIKSSLKETIDDINNSMKNLEESSRKVEISVYAKGLFNKGIKYEISFVDEDDKTTLTYSNYKDVIKIDFSNNSEKLLNATITKESKNHYKTIAKMDSLKLEINSDFSDNKNTHKYKLTESESKMVISGTITSENKEIKKNKEYSGNIKTTCNMSVADQKDIVKLKVNGKSETIIGDSIKMPNIDKTIEYKNISSNDYYEIMNNLYQNKKLMEFVSKISGY